MMGRGEAEGGVEDQENLKMDVADRQSAGQADRQTESD